MKDIGQLLLGCWLIITGLRSVIGLHFNHQYEVLGVLAIVAGAFLLLRR